ncbi:hypothetical protein ABCR94_00575 [Streptomyces sp. 21So2-11]|uniref:hypothetical protein n=1 Tax=Streptomyces sp. 21So2-11 TaxID=3144408 RepID=UPI00321BF104
MEAVTWLRPEYEGHEDALVTLADGARLVGVSRSAVSNWAKRHTDFPRLVLLTGPLSKRIKYVVREELVDFARTQRNKTRKPPGGYKPRRPTVELRADAVTHYTQQVARLAELVTRHKQALAGAEARLRTAQQRLRKARIQLTAELTASHTYRSLAPAPHQKDQP